MEEKELISSTKITCLINNTSNKEYGLFIDKLILIEQGDQKVILNRPILEYLESVIGAKFKI